MFSRIEIAFLGTDLEELYSGAALHGAVPDLALLGQVLGRLDRIDHPLDGQESS